MEEVGERIRELRKGQGLTLKELADRCDLSASFLSQVERGLSSASIASIHTIARGLSTTLSEFFDGVDRSMGATSLERPERRASIVKLTNEIGIRFSDAAIKYSFLSSDFPGRQFEIVIGEISPGHRYPPVPHEGEEFGYVLAGKLRLIAGKKTHILGPGDSYHFDASTPHGYEVEGEDAVRVLWVGTLKYFQERGAVPASVNDHAHVPPSGE